MDTQSAGAQTPCAEDAGPEMTVVRARRDATRVLAEDRPLAGALPGLGRAVELVVASVRPEDKVGSFLRSLREAVSQAAGRLVHVTCDEFAPDPGLVPVCLKALAANPGADALMIGLRRVTDRDEDRPALLEPSRVSRFAELVAFSEALAVPGRLLSLFVLRPAVLLALLDSLGDPSALALSELELAQRLFLAVTGLGKGRLLRLDAPLTTLREPLSPRRALARGVELLRAERFEEALAVLDGQKATGVVTADLQYLRAVAKLKLGLAVEACLAATAAAALPGASKEAGELAQTLRDKGFGAVEEYGRVAQGVQGIEGYISGEQEQYLFEKVRSLPPDAAILEVGCCYGRSTAAMAFACAGSNRRILSMDTFFGNDGDMGREADFMDLWRWNLSRFDLEEFATPCQGYSFETLPRLDPARRFDFAFIDASHEYEDVIRDFEMVYPFIKDGGWIAFHDVEPVWSGPWRLWRQSGSQVLVDHEHRGSLAAGRKVAGRPFQANREVEVRYDEDWALSVRGLGPAFESIFVALLLTSRLYRSVEPRQDETGPNLAALEKVVSRLSPTLRHGLRFMIAKEGTECGPLRYWNALNFGEEGQIEEARREAARAVELCPGWFRNRLARLTF